MTRRLRRVGLETSTRNGVLHYKNKRNQHNGIYRYTRISDRRDKNTYYNHILEITTEKMNVL